MYAELFLPFHISKLFCPVFNSPVHVYVFVQECQKRKIRFILDVSTERLGVCFFICLFGVYRHTREFHSYGDVTIADEGLKTLTPYAERLAV